MRQVEESIKEIDYNGEKIQYILIIPFKLTLVNRKNTLCF